MANGKIRAARIAYEANLFNVRTEARSSRIRTNLLELNGSGTLRTSYLDGLTLVSVDHSQYTIDEMIEEGGHTRSIGYHTVSRI